MSTTKLVAPAGTQGGTVIQTDYGNYDVDGDGTVTVDSRAVTALLGAGYLLFSDDLPVGKAVTGGSHTVTSGEASAHAAVIDTGLTTVDTFIVQITRAGVVLAEADVSEALGSITVADNSTDYVVTTGDVINWIAYGAA